MIDCAEHADENGKVTDGVLIMTESGNTEDYKESMTSGLGKNHEPKSVRANGKDRAHTGKHNDIAHHSIDGATVTKPDDG